MSGSFLGRMSSDFDQNQHKQTLGYFWEICVSNFENSDFSSTKNWFFGFSDFFRALFLAGVEFWLRHPIRQKIFFWRKKIVFRKFYPRTATYPKIIGNASRSSENCPENDLSRHYHEFESTLSRRALSSTLLPTVQKILNLTVKAKAVHDFCRN